MIVTLDMIDKAMRKMVELQWVHSSELEEPEARREVFLILDEALAEDPPVTGDVPVTRKDFL